MTVKNAPDRIRQSMYHVDKNRLVTAVGIAPGCLAHLSRHDAEMLAVYSEMLSGISSWILADLLLWVERKLAEETGTGSGAAFWLERDRRWSQLTGLMRRDYDPHTLTNYRATARAWPHPRRHHDMSFSHHKTLIAYPEQEQEYWMGLAREMGWSARRMEAEMRAPSIDLEPPVGGYPPRPSVAQVAEDLFGAHRIHLRHDLPNLAVFATERIEVEIEAIVENNQPKLEFRIKEEPS